MNKHYELARILGISQMLRDCENGRTIHEIRNLQAALKNWEHLLDKREDFLDAEKENFRKVMERAKSIIRRERKNV